MPSCARADDFVTIRLIQRQSEERDMSDPRWFTAMIYRENVKSVTLNDDLLRAQFDLDK